MPRCFAVAIVCRAHYDGRGDGPQIEVKYYLREELVLLSVFD